MKQSAFVFRKYENRSAIVVFIIFQRSPISKIGLIILSQIRDQLGEGCCGDTWSLAFLGTE